MKETTQDKLDIAPIEDKTSETPLRWFGHVQRRSTDATVKKSHSLEATDTSTGREKPKKT